MTTTGLRIAAIHNRRSGARELNDEYILIHNEGTQPQPLAGFAVTSRAARHRPDCRYILPHRVYTEGQSAGGWTCGPGGLIFIRSGEGRDQFFPKSADDPGQFHFYMGRHDFAWDTVGEQVYLRHPNGHFVTVPFPVP